MPAFIPVGEKRICQTIIFSFLKQKNTRVLPIGLSVRSTQTTIRFIYILLDSIKVLLFTLLSIDHAQNKK